VPDAAPSLSSSAQRVQDALEALGLDCRVAEYQSAARTSAEAAAVLGCAVGQIAKSLIFRGSSGLPVLVIASGANRIDEKKVAALLGEAIHKADADFVRAATGYAIGGIPPVGHAQRIATLIDEDLLQFDVIFAAGGTPHAMFPVVPRELVRASGGRIGQVRAEAFAKQWERE
jgi:prolyl-tRNA editing enzyme YbaK/EbsC (Cys-tRNA(Pro) deacylase)